MASARRVLGAFGFAIAILVASGCAKEAEAPPRPPVEVGFVEVGSRPVTLTTELAGRTRAFLSSEVRPQVEGIIEARLFTEGSKVEAGEPLYRIASERYEAARDQAQAALASARASLVALEAKAERYEALIDSEAVSDQEVADVVASAQQGRAAVARARAELETARINLDFTTIEAPISGRIGRSSVTPGALVTANQAEPLAIIQTLDPIYVDISQSSAELLALRRSLASGSGMPASAEVDLLLHDGTKYEHQGTLEFAEAMVNPGMGTVTLRAVFPNPDGVLLPGMFVRAVVPQRVIPDAVLVPQQGISRDPRGNATALVLGPGDEVVVRQVTAERAVGSEWLVSAGLEPGDRLIVEGVDKVRPGQVVAPVEVDLTPTKE